MATEAERLVDVVVGGLRGPRGTRRPGSGRPPADASEVREEEAGHAAEGAGSRQVTAPGNEGRQLLSG